MLLKLYYFMPYAFLLFLQLASWDSLRYKLELKWFWYLASEIFIAAILALYVNKFLSM